MKRYMVALFALAAILAITPTAASAGTVTYSGTGLAGLLYQAAPDAQYVAASGAIPAYASLSTPDSGLSGDSPAVYVLGSTMGTLSSFSGIYNLLNSSGGNGNPPYWILWVNTDGTTDPGSSNYLGIIGMGGTTIDGSSAIHVIDPLNKVSPTYWGQSLSSIFDDTYTYNGVKFGSMPVTWAGVEIGNWDNNGSIVSASAEIDSITVPATATVPEPGILALLGLGSGLLGLVGFRPSMLLGKV
jgi:hypothetical protein